MSLAGFIMRPPAPDPAATTNRVMEALMSDAHENWRRWAPDQARELAADDPKHLQMMEEGWSWIEHVGGPKDGVRSYFVGSPKWELCFVDASVDPSKYEPGDLEHKYVLSEGEHGHAVYKWQGEFRRPK